MRGSSRSTGGCVTNCSTAGVRLAIRGSRPDRILARRLQHQPAPQQPARDDPTQFATSWTTQPQPA
jgi:hypothetical protein